MRFELDGHIYEGPTPSGSDGLALYARVWATLAQLGQLERHLLDGAVSLEEATALVTLARLLCAAPTGQALIVATLAGYTVDGQRIHTESIPGIYGTPGRWSEHGTAAVRVWKEAGFFRVAGTGSPALPPVEETTKAD